MEAHPQSKRWLKILLLAIDVAGITATYLLATWLRLGTVNLGHFLPNLLFVFVPFNLICLYLFDLYRVEADSAAWKVPLQALGAGFVSGCVIILVAYLGGAIEFSGLIGRGVLIGAQASFAIWAAAHRFWFGKWLRSLSLRSRWLVLATDDHIRALIRDLKTNSISGHFAFLTPSAEMPALEAMGENGGTQLSLTHLGVWSELEQAASHNWSGVIVGAGGSLPDKVVDVLMHIRLTGVRVIDLADFYEQTWFKVPVFYLQRSWFAMSEGFHLLHNPIGLRIKRLFDAVVAAILLLLSTPVLLLTMLAIKLESRGPVIFKQTRVGENGRLFTVLKLRSMRTDAEKDGAQWAAVNDNRVTRVGAFIRATRIDEIPQLINVLRGDMSFIGPRPERPEFTEMLEKEIPFFALRHLLRPGVTGWAQVMFPYGASVEDAREKLQYDLYYIKNYSLLLDAAIVLKTVRVVLFGKGR
jgi:sugar transferase (PEP-CTERM system associated)